MDKKLIIATRKSPLALAQTVLVEARLSAVLGCTTEQLRIVTTGDQQAAWSLEKQGGKGLFTGELEQALLRGEAHLAVHSTKDLPGEMPAGLAIAGYLPREDTRDLLVLRTGVDTPAKIATGSPRRRLQVARLFPHAQFNEIRGNVDTRLKKIAAGEADATILATAGLKRLGIASWPGLVFRPLKHTEMVPAVGQGAIGIQCRAGDEAQFGLVFDPATARSVTIERAFQTALGGGCHTAFGAHATTDTLYLFHEKTGSTRHGITPADAAAPADFARRTLRALGLL